MAVNSTFDGVQINDLSKWSISGSSNPLIFDMPRGIGTLLKPSGVVNRIITLTSQRFPASDKTAIETLQHELNEFLIMEGKGTLVVNGVTYTKAVPQSVSQNILSTSNYMSYSIVFELDRDQQVFSPELVDGRVRPGDFTNYCGAHGKFPIFDNYEAGISVQYGMNEKPRAVGQSSTTKYPAHGYEVISLECWMVGQTHINFQKYISDFVMDPLGKMGKLNLNGLVFNNAILVAVDSSEHIASSMKYTLTFNATLAC